MAFSNKVILLEISPTLNDEPMHKLGIVTMAFSDMPHDDKSDRYHMKIVENLFMFFRKKIDEKHQIFISIWFQLKCCVSKTWRKWCTKPLDQYFNVMLLIFLSNIFLVNESQICSNGTGWFEKIKCPLLHGVGENSYTKHHVKVWSAKPAP